MASCVAPAESQYYFSSVSGYVASYLDQVADNCPDPSPLYRMPAPRRTFSFQGLLPDHTEHIICEYHKLKHKLVCIDFSGR